MSIIAYEDVGLHKHCLRYVDKVRLIYVRFRDIKKPSDLSPERATDLARSLNAAVDEWRSAVREAHAFLDDPVSPPSDLDPEDEEEEEEEYEDAELTLAICAGTVEYIPGRPLPDAVRRRFKSGL